jgi:hypothetical protein
MAARMRKWLSDRSELAGLCTVLALGAWLRLGWPGVSPFAFDEARVSDLALQMARQGQFATLGMPSSTGIPNLPATVWLCALLFAVSIHPQVAIAFTGLLNVLAIAGIWWLAREAWAKWPGLIAALLFASSPYLVFYGHSIWSQDLLAPFAVLWAVTAVVGVRRDSALALGLHAFLAGLSGNSTWPVSAWPWLPSGSACASASGGTGGPLRSGPRLPCWLPCPPCARLPVVGDGSRLTWRASWHRRQR